MNKYFSILFIYFSLLVNIFAQERPTFRLNPAVNIANQTPITNLIVSETFEAGDFPVKILELTGSSPYSGKGFIVVPYLADTKIAVEFNNITVNTNYQLINGVVETTYNPAWNNVLDLDPVILQIFGDQSETQRTEDPGVEDSAYKDTTGNPDGNTNTNTGNTNTTGTGNTNPNGSNNTENNPDTGNTTTTGNKTTNTTTNSTASTNSSGTNSTGNDYYIEYKGQKFFNGGKIKIPYKRYMIETFEMKTLASDAKVDFTIHEPGKQEMW